MKVFIIGLPQSGRTTIANSLSSLDGFAYIQATAWLKESFRSPNPNENHHQFNDEYHHFLTNRLKINPDIFASNVEDAIKSNMMDGKSNFIIDGINSPRDFIKLFDYNKDVIVFLNRTDAEPEYKDYENISISVIRDYCFWLSSASLLTKDRWLELNFKIPGEETDQIKFLGSKNTVCIVKSINNAQRHLKSHITGLL